jgi:hypothetical protein
MHAKFTAAVIASAVATWAGAGTAHASLLTDLTEDTCTANNCGSELLSGTVVRYIGTFAYPWVAQAVGVTGNCLRFEVISQTQDLEMTVVAPNGNVYRNDDQVGNDRPLVKINPAPNTGLYTIHISSFNGNPIDSNFQLRWNRYNGGNPNCASPTPASAERGKK